MLKRIQEEEERIANSFCVKVLGFSADIFRTEPTHALPSGELVRVTDCRANRNPATETLVIEYRTGDAAGKIGTVERTQLTELKE
jgi:hypothetical protein